MATIFFSLKNPKAKEKTLIYIIFCHKDTTIKISSGQRIRPRDWHQKNQCMRSTMRNVDVDNFNTWLKNKRELLISTYRSLVPENGILHKEKIIEAFREVLRPTVENTPQKVTFIQLAEEYVKVSGKKHWTKKHYGTAINRLKDFEIETNQTLQFEDINIKFYNTFVEWCEKKGMALNTIGSHIKEIKVFMNYANDIGATECIGHLHKKFRVMDETSDSIYLNEVEISQIYNAVCNEKHMDRIRDIFIIGCWTGLRYADLVNISKDQFIKDGTVLKVKTEKTGEIVHIPLHTHVKEIMAKYDGHLPGPYTDQHMNRVLKDIAREAKLNDKVIKTITRGGKRETISKKKHELVTVHTARRSFATNAFLANVPVLSIMKITSHRTEKSFLKYIKLSSEQNAEILKDHRFFNVPVTN
jgi:integrase